MNDSEPSQQQLTFLLRQRVGRLATVGRDGQPHVVPVCFAVLDGLIYTPLDGKPKRVGATQLRRVRDLEQNPALCLIVDEYDEDWTRLHWLQIRGRGAIVRPGSERRDAIAALRQRYEQYHAMAMDDAPVIRLTPERVVEWSWSGRTG